MENGVINRYCWECSLGYDIDCIKGIPKEYCPKPRTIAELVSCSRRR